MELVDSSSVGHGGSFWKLPRISHPNSSPHYQNIALQTQYTRKNKLEKEGETGNYLHVLLVFLSSKEGEKIHLYSYTVTCLKATRGIKEDNRF